VAAGAFDDPGAWIVISGLGTSLTALSWSLTIDPQEAFDRIVCPWAPWRQVALLHWPKAARREL